MSHMPEYGSGGSGCEASTCGERRIVTYTATGAEGVDFMVTIGATLAADDYEVSFFGAKGATMIPAVWDFPDALAGDRTTTQFRVLVPDVLVLSDVFLFEIVE